MERGAFLDNLRVRLANGAHPSLPHPLVALDGSPAVVYDQELSDPVAAFVGNARMLGVSASVISDVEGFVCDVAREIGAESVILSGDPETEGLGSLASSGIALVPFDGPRAEPDLGVVGARFGIAATGTVVFDSGRAGGRSASLLAPAVIVLLRASSILPDAGELFGRMAALFPDGPPSQLVLCSGPSKSGDIEFELTTGVHGPGRVWIGITT